MLLRAMFFHVSGHPRSLRPLPPPSIRREDFKFSPHAIASQRQGVVTPTSVELLATLIPMLPRHAS